MRAASESQPRLLVAALVCAAAGAAVFQFFGNASRGYIDTTSLFYWWGYQWVNPASETQHGLLILGLSGWLFWRALHARDEGEGRGSEGGGHKTEKAGLHATSTSEVSPSSVVCPPSSDFWPALTAMIGALGLHLIGFAVQQSRISVLALLLFTWGVLRLMGGRRWGSAAMFPVAFLVFAIPLNVLDTVGFWLRLWVIKASSGIAHGCGIGVIQNGTQLFAPDGRYQYDVAAACSGVRSLMALTSLSLLIGYLWFYSWWRRGLMLLLCFPLVYVGNVARITGIIFAGHWKGQEWGERVHDVMGFGIFAIVLGGVLLAAEALRRWCPEKAGSADRSSANESDVSDAGQRDETKANSVSVPTTDGSASRPYQVAAAVVILSIGAMVFLQRLASSPARGSAGVALSQDGKDPVDLPTFLGTEWIGRRAEVTPIEREILPEDTGFSRKLYVPLSDPSQAVFVSVVLSGRDRSSIHRPEICLVGQGWTIVDSSPFHFRQASPGAGTFPATMLTAQRTLITPRGRETSPDLVAYWFVNSDGVAPTQWSRFRADAWNRLVHQRVDRWAYVLIQTTARDGRENALRRLQTVLDQVLPTLQPAPPSAASSRVPTDQVSSNR